MDGRRLPLLDHDAAMSIATENGIPPQLASYNSFRIFLHNPRVALTLSSVLRSFLLQGNGSLDIRTKELIILRIAWKTGSHYEWNQHLRIARGLGITEAALMAVKEWQHSADLQPSDLILLNATDELLAAGFMSDPVWEDCRSVLQSMDALVEFVSLVAVFAALSMVLRALDVPQEGDDASSEIDLNATFE